ncbi:MAG: trehalose-phosphatase [Bacteroidota bacterium]
MNLKEHLSSVVNAFCQAKRRTIFLDYDGTLAPFSLRPADARPSLDLLQTLHRLSDNPLQQVVIISGRDRESLENWLAHLPLTLVAEHGAYYKTYHREWRVVESQDAAWKREVRAVLDGLAAHYPGTHVEEKTLSLVWHFRALGDRLPAFDIDKITRMLEVEGSQRGFVVYPGEMAIELRTPGVDKGSFAQMWLAKHPSDFVLAVGDGETDEDLFATLSAPHVTVKVGFNNTSKAGYFVRDTDEVLQLLNQLANAMRPPLGA